MATQIEAVFKKYFWAIRLAGIAVVVAFAASAVSTQFGASFVLTEDDGGMVADAPDEDEDEDEEEDKSNEAFMRKAIGSMSSGGGNKDNLAEAVVKQNFFCPSCAPVDESQQPANTPLRPGEIKSSLPLQLLATMESNDPLYSLATIRDTENETLGPYGIKDEVRPGVSVHEVGRGRVVLRNGAQLEYIELGEEPPPKASSARAKPKETKSASKNKHAIDGAEDAIDCKGENCTVDREFVEQILNNPGMLAKQARVVPAIKDGETRGFKFYGIRPGSLPKLLGLKNGDLLTSVNGNELKSLDQAMGLYTKLRRASHLSVTLERKGKTIQKEVDIK
jgi:general secretion pathway protein C